ncbi:MAG: hypothetical protein ACLQBX_16485 [Candidatus Limnocylindrales bacterium]
MAEPAYGWDADRRATLRTLVERADRGDQTALPGVRQIFDAVPGIWESYGDLATQAQNALIAVVAGRSPLTREGLRKKLASTRAELEGPNASPLEKLLVERIVTSWLQCHQADLAYARSLKGSSPSESELCHRRQDRAARQYLYALRSLAQVRRLLAPPVQVNLAQQQVNVAGGQVHFGTRE